MEKMLMLVLLLISAVAIRSQEDMNDKVFVFSETSTKSYVRLIPESDGPYAALTVCLKFYTELARDYSLFSLATTDKDNDFLLYYSHPNNLSVSIGNEELYFSMERRVEWTALCVAWNSTSGEVDLWINGKLKPRRIFRKGYTVNAKPIIIIGQEQDSYGGKFDASQSFVGEISGIQMWDKFINQANLDPPCNSLYRAIINWKYLKYESQGDVAVLAEMCKIYYSFSC
ncbi:hypothetical protein GDO86_020534 [Hymenochirus boettgeri]|uniref:Pentraxin family member n=1 Tax=Hymenochirus boettgeri TaxID=247094 RepID=A0A8T2IBQ4_9PIPI|nr:hypothetical protein GDO86_020534 [Hymenochirus boettgeri]KAG8430475.1 hypothetical protein GDO86_020534 [Hymenochirus boettgeri]